MTPGPRLDDTPGRIVQTTGAASTLTIFVALAMAFLSVFALALLFANGRAADQWAADLDGVATVRVPDGDTETANQVLALLDQTPGIGAVTPLGEAEQRALLEPWLGPDVPVDLLDLPILIDVLVEDGLDADGLQLRLDAETPGVVFDDHGRWRVPMIQAASRLRLIGATALLLLLGSLTAMIIVATRAAIAGNIQVIEVLRLIGAEDKFVVRAFTRRFALRSLVGALVGTGIGIFAVFAIPRADTLVMDLAFRGTEWVWAFLIPPFAGLVAYLASRIVTERHLKEML